MCGIIGIIGTENVNQALYSGLTVLQHRGQDAAGIITSDGDRVYLRKDNGLVRDVFHTRHMVQLKGFMGIGHVRYPTAGSDSRAEAQPFYVNSPFGIALGHNGNLTNTESLRNALFEQDLRQINTTSDSEVLLNIFAHELRNTLDTSSLRASKDDIFQAVTGVFKRCRGAYSIVAMVVGVGIVAFRDPFGVRPLTYGAKQSEKGVSHMFASESAALDVLNYTRIGDIAAGEVVIVDMMGEVYRKICAEYTQSVPCIFEYVYLARPDSIIDDIPVYQTRMNMGKKLGKHLKKAWVDHDIDVVIPVPDTSRTAALEMAKVLGRPFREGFIKNQYIGRTFIMPGQEERKKSIKQKLNSIGSEFAGKNVLLVDDSIVRGTTSKEIIKLARDAGAKKVYFASAAPPVCFPNVYGIDMPTSSELIASDKDISEICTILGADKLIYQKLDDLIDAVKEGQTSVTRFDTSCFDGRYVTGDITKDYLNIVDAERNNAAKRTTSSELDNSQLSEIMEKSA